MANTSSIRHVFVLMLENRSFDHMLGFSGITGTDAATGQPTRIDGLSGKETNVFNGVTHVVTQPADLVMPVDPAHEFTDVLTQLCGLNASYQPGGAYPPVNNSGFVANYFANGGQPHPSEIMKCYGAGQLPVLGALAKEFVVFDRWFSSLPGPTWPNRFFAHAASSGGLDHSPSSGEIALWEVIAGFQFEKGTLFDALNTISSDHAWRIYSGGGFPCVAALKGINNLEIHDFDDFAADVGSADYPVLYTFIEPNYGDILGNTYRGGTSQHPLDDVTHGEGLIKSVYEAIRNSPAWDSSLLIVTWDEHGGFYDHVAPPAAVSPGDSIVTSGASQYGFTFQQYGVRVPAVAVSPLIPANLIDHRTYDHASIPATVERLFGLGPLTQRDARANSVASLATLAVPRTDAPLTLPKPIASSAPAALAARAVVAPSAPAAAPTDSIDKGNLPGFLHAVLRTDLDLSPAAQRPAIVGRFNTIKTRAQAQQYMDEVRRKAKAAGASSLASRTKL
jgi:phospholipase C